MTAVLESPPTPADAPPFGSRPSAGNLIVGRFVTALLVVGPVAAVAIAVPLLWGRAVGLLDITLAAFFYSVSGFGVTVGYHRLFTHRSFRAARWLKIALAVAGSMAIEGSVVDWVATHRRHHAFSDKPGDPHSPHGHGAGVIAQARGFVHAHVGWLFKGDTTAADRYAGDLIGDADTKVVSKLFPLIAVLSLALPFLLGWVLSGAIAGAITALVWAGLMRMMVLHHVTWSVNSICHMFGKQPATERDHSTNFAPLAILSFGESWHNFHHAHPRSARHGALRHQVDPSAALIRMFERTGCATQVRWPTSAQVALCRVG